MTPVQRVTLDRRIAEERMVEIDPHGIEPVALTDCFDSRAQPRCWTMNAFGEVSLGHQLLDEVIWYDVVAVRLEHAWGHPIDAASLLTENDEPWLEGIARLAGESADA